MLAWIWDILVGNFCRHKWELNATHDVYYGNDSKPYTTKYVHICSKCAKVKTQKT